MQYGLEPNSHARLSSCLGHHKFLHKNEFLDMFQNNLTLAVYRYFGKGFVLIGVLSLVIFDFGSLRADSGRHLTPWVGLSV